MSTIGKGSNPDSFTEALFRKSNRLNVTGPKLWDLIYCSVKEASLKAGLVHISSKKGVKLKSLLQTCECCQKCYKQGRLDSMGANPTGTPNTFNKHPLLMSLTAYSEHPILTERRLLGCFFYHFVLCMLLKLQEFDFVHKKGQIKESLGLAF